MASTKKPAAPPAPAPQKQPAAQKPQEQPSRNEQKISRPGADAVAKRAYELWQKRGAPHGSDQEDWHRAEQELEKPS